MLQIKNCSYHYNNQQPTLDNINLNIEPGCFFGLLGENGAGKTTLINLIVSILKLQSGSILINNLSITKNPLEYKQILGWVPQEFNFAAFHTLEYMLQINAGYYGITPRKAKQRIQFLLESLDLWERRKMKIRQLSGGLKRRLMIARSLLHEPKILLLDEPTAGVDINMRQKTWDFLQLLNHEEKITIILTSHYIEEIEKLCNQVAVLNKGAIIKNNNLQELLKDYAQETTYIQIQEKIPENILTIENAEFNFDTNTIALAINRPDQLNTAIKKIQSCHLTINRVFSEQTKLATLLKKWTQT